MYLSSNKKIRAVILFTYSLMILSTRLFAQSTIEGIVVTNRNEPLPGAAIIIINKNDTTIYKGTATNSSGHFRIETIVTGNYILKVSFLGYKSKRLAIIHNGNQTSNIGVITMQETSKQLSEVVVTHKVAIATVKGDTTEYNADSYQVNKDAVAEDLITKIPGVIVGNDGTVSAEGENVKKVFVDGKPFFGDDATIALKNLPAEVIDKVQIYDKASEQSEFTGFKDGQTSKTINIITKQDKRNGVFGKFLAGYATDNRYQIYGNVNLFSGNRRISFIGMSNNSNQQNFESQDMISPGKGNNGNGSNAGGINTIHSWGTNYSDNWGKKVVVTASYFYNQTKNLTATNSNRTTFINDSTNNYSKEKSSTNTENYNHRFNMRMDYTIDSSNSITVLPSFSYEHSKALGNTTDSALNNKLILLSRSHSLTDNTNQGYDFENTITYRHKLLKKGRTFFIDFSQSASKNDGNNSTQTELFYAGKTALLDTTNQIIKSSSGDYKLSSRCSYTEPIGTFSMLMVSYVPSIEYNKSDKQTTKALIVDSGLSGNYIYHTITQRGGFAYHFNKQALNLSTGFDLQDVNLDGNESFPNQITTNTSYTNILPRADVSYKFADHNSVHISYMSSTQTPTITQLQNTVNNTNQLSLSVGNPLLDQQYNHSFRANIRIVDYSLTKTLFLAIQSSLSDNYITQSTYTATADTTINNIILHHGTQLSQPRNMKGYRSFHPFITYSFPVYLIKCNINIRGEYSFTRQPGMVNNEINFSDNNASGGDISINSNISPNIDFRLSYKANYNIVRNSIQTASDKNYYTGNATARASILALNHISFTTDFNLTHYNGLGSMYDKASVLWNAGIAYKFLKNNAGECKLSIYDILNKNKSITHTVTGTYIDDSQTNIIKRYLMFTITYNIRKF